MEERQGVEKRGADSAAEITISSQITQRPRAHSAWATKVLEEVLVCEQSMEERRSVETRGAHAIGSSQVTSTQPTGPYLDPLSDEKKSVSIRTKDNELTVEKKQLGLKAGDTDRVRRKHDSRLPPVNKDTVSGVEDKSTRKRKRPESPVVPSKRGKSDESVSFKDGIQCLIRGFSALCL